MTAQSDFQPNDHDLLIELKSDFKNFTQMYQVDMKDLKEGTTRTLADHEIRIKKMEDLIVEIRPKTTTTAFWKLKGEIHDYMVRIETTKYVVGFVSAIVGAAFTFFVTQLPSVLRSWHIID